eukprot:TRINITY_DN967_c0_g2_i2.p1 TRINITY_DN967_c0_g2~~TRINITY_DN967_c0_g2_i2.p1  ORF type:complete len:135 (-),score=19.91 TRINITY_DN967_c0_g2_i2:526-930(-)
MFGDKAMYQMPSDVTSPTNSDFKQSGETEIVSLPSSTTTGTVPQNKTLRIPFETQCAKCGTNLFPILDVNVNPNGESFARYVCSVCHTRNKVKITQEMLGELNAKDKNVPVNVWKLVFCCCCIVTTAIFGDKCC